MCCKIQKCQQFYVNEQQQNMTTNEHFVVTSARLKTVVYEEGFTLKIEKFEDWWPLMRLDEEVTSQIFEMEVAGCQHKFQLSVKKYIDCSFTCNHNVLLSLSLFYHGPANSILLRPHFRIRTEPAIFQTLGRTLKTKRLYKNKHSDEWVWSDYWLNGFKDEWNTEKDGSLTFCTLIKIKVADESPGNVVF